MRVARKRPCAVRQDDNRFLCDGNPNHAYQKCFYLLLLTWWSFNVTLVWSIFLLIAYSFYLNQLQWFCLLSPEKRREKKKCITTSRTIESVDFLHFDEDDLIYWGIPLLGHYQWNFYHDYIHQSYFLEYLVKLFVLFRYLTSEESISVIYCFVFMWLSISIIIDLLHNMPRFFHTLKRNISFFYM